MVNVFQNTVIAGTGDVNMSYGVYWPEGTPVGMVNFSNNPHSEGRIEIIPDDYVCPDKEPKQINRKNSITLAFSSPKSIDAVIAVLKHVKKVAFTDNEERDLFYQSAQKMMTADGQASSSAE